MNREHFLIYIIIYFIIYIKSRVENLSSTIKINKEYLIVYFTLENDREDRNKNGKTEQKPFFYVNSNVNY